jgi:hypothetical protein
MNLAQTYALETGLALDKPYISRKFFPIPEDLSKVVLIHAGGGNAGFPAKLYSHYNEVVSLLKPILERYGYIIYQIGGPEEKSLRGINNLSGRASFQQTAYMLAGAALFIGNDSINSHIRGSFLKPMITLFGPTSPKNHGPNWCNPDTTILLDSHKSGNSYSYLTSEPTKTIDFIAPETVVNSALKLLGISDRVTQHTYAIGNVYRQIFIEMVPDHIPDTNFFPNASMTVRLDYLPNPSAIAQIAPYRKISIITRDQVSIKDLIEFRKNIEGLIIEIDENTDPAYIEKVKRAGIKMAAFSREKDEKKLADLRFKFYDNFYIEKYHEKTKEDFIESAEEYLNTKLDKDIKISELRFKSNKFLLADGKIYLSKAHYLKGISVPSIKENVGEVIDSPDFWLEQDNMLIFKNE